MTIALLLKEEEEKHVYVCNNNIICMYKVVILMACNIMCMYVYVIASLLIYFY